MMTTRRTALLLTFGLPAAFRAIPAWAAAAKTFWNEKKPEDWSADEIDELLNRSPWARDIVANMKGQLGAGPAPKSNRGYNVGGGAGGRGSRGGGGDTGSSKSDKDKDNVVIGTFRGVVRWESAIPVRLAQKKEALPEAADYYILSVSGLPMAGSGRRAKEDESDAPDAEEVAARIKDETRLTPQHRDPILPEKIDNSSKRGALFYFRRDAEQLTVEHKEVTFTSKLGPLEVKAKFSLKDMLYRGKLEL
jgi:hypothetical protein